MLNWAATLHNSMALQVIHLDTCRLQLFIHPVNYYQLINFNLIGC